MQWLYYCCDYVLTQPVAQDAQNSTGFVAASFKSTSSLELTAWGCECPQIHENSSLGISREVSGKGQMQRADLCLDQTKFCHSPCHSTVTDVGLG